MSRTKVLVALAASASLLAVLGLTLVPVASPGVPEPISPPWLGEALWQGRGLDMALQAFIILAGAMAIVLLLRREPGGLSGG